MNDPSSSGVQSGMLVRDEYGFYEIPPELSSKIPASASISAESTQVPAPSMSSTAQHRSGSRALKRKKMRNAVVKPTSGVQPSAPKPSRSSTNTKSKAGSGATFDDFAIPSIITPAAAQPERPKQQTKRNSRNKNQIHLSNALKGLGRWKATDDLALIIGVEQTNDLKTVHRATKFSCRFTLQELQHRWHALLYDNDISKLAVQAMKNLQTTVVASVQARALFSQAEEHLLETIKSTPAPPLETFQKLLETNPQTFYPGRTAKRLMNHWQLMEHFQLLPDQTVQPLLPYEEVMNFSDAEDMIHDKELLEQNNELFDIEMAIADRQNKMEIRILENELSRWLVLVDSLTGAFPPDFDHQTLAILKGKVVKYRMKSKEITVGRATKDYSVDIDLTLEGPVKKVSRRQATIRMRSNGDFLLSSEGKRPIFVDSRPLLAGNKCKVKNNSVIEIAQLQFVFLINQELRSMIRQEWEETFKAELQSLKSKRRR